MSHWEQITHKETWVNIPSYEGFYQVSNLGRVKAVSKLDTIGRSLKPKILKPTKCKKGYLGVVLYKEGIRKSYMIHRLVIWGFMNVELPRGMLKLQVNHKNGVKNDNRICNLEVVTPKENIEHARNMRLSKCYNKGQDNKYAKAVRCLKNGKVVREFGAIVTASLETGILQQNISATLRGLRKSAGGYEWEYI